MNTWADLANLREAGLRPGLPLIITTYRDSRIANFEEMGCMVIMHTAGTKFHVELLEGLRVWLFLGGCEKPAAIARLAKVKGTQPEELCCWCECHKTLVANPVGCTLEEEWAA